MHWQALTIIVAYLALMSACPARDNGQWERSPPEVREWFRSLAQPDNPSVSCCGEADAYYTTFPYARDGKMFIKIDDDRNDLMLGRKHIDNGTEIEIPEYKIKKDQGNPTGRAIVFLSRGMYVYCFVMPGGA